MKKSTTFVGAFLTLCTATLVAGGASGQSLEPKAANPVGKAAVPHPRAAQKSEKTYPKAQERVGSNGNPASPAPAPGATPVQPTATPPGETQNFQGWIVTCLPQPADKSPRTCVAKMGVLKSNEDRRPILFQSVIKTGGSATFVLQTPTGVDLKSGVTVQIGKNAPRHLTYESCEPSLCTATVPMDDAFVQELASAPNATATWVGIGVGDVRVEYALQEARNTLAYLVSR